MGLFGDRICDAWKGSLGTLAEIVASTGVLVHGG